jgi:hypothetical protein
VFQLVRSRSICDLRGFFPGDLLTEWMYVLKAGKPLQDGGQLLGERLLRIFDLAGVECCDHVSQVPATVCSVKITSDPADFETGSNLGGETSLGAAQHDVQEFLARGHRLYLLPCRFHICDFSRSGCENKRMGSRSLRLSPVDDRRQKVLCV